MLQTSSESTMLITSLERAWTEAPSIVEDDPRPSVPLSNHNELNSRNIERASTPLQQNHSRVCDPGHLASRVRNKLKKLETE
ncbi:hypothetical protein TNCV_3964951 [Trichonephila clavipes]|nr:hypothetical protein TNCV_3964951 [Trichonephila clavipes]